MNTKIMRKIVGYKCIYCGVVTKECTDIHPPSARFVNGYPAPCEYIGRNMGCGVIKEDEMPWVMAVVENYQ